MQAGYLPYQVLSRDAWRLVKLIKFTFPQILSSLTAVGEPFDVSCALLSSTTHWQGWVVPDTMVWDYVWYSAMGLGLIIGYVSHRTLQLIYGSNYLHRPFGSCCRALGWSRVKEPPLMPLPAKSDSPAVACVSLLGGAERLITKDEQVTIGIAKGDLVERGHSVRVIVMCEDRSAKFGRDYSGIALIPSSNGVEAELLDARSLALTFPPGEVLAAIRLQSRGRCRYQPTLELCVKISDARVVSPRSSSSEKLDVDIGPVVTTKLRVVNLDAFPDGLQLTYEKEPTFAQRVRLVRSFVREMMKIPNARKAFWVYEVVNIVLVVFDTFVANHLYSNFVRFAMNEFRTDWAFLVAIIYFAVEVYRYHLTLHYFTLGDTVKYHLTWLLYSKFASFSDADLASIPDCVQETRVACSKYVGAWMVEPNTTLQPCAQLLPLRTALNPHDSRILCSSLTCS